MTTFNPAYASVSGLKDSKEFSFLIGMSNVSFQESEVDLTGPNKTEAASGSVSNISGLLHYRFMNYNQWAIFGQFVFPLLASTGTYLSGGSGLEYSFGRATSKKTLVDQTTTFTLTPITRYFLITSLNASYLSYKTESAVKQDTILDIEAGAGIARRISKYNLRAQASMCKGVGVATSTMAMRLYLGGTFYLVDRLINFAKT